MPRSREAWAAYSIAASFLATALALALKHVSPEHFALFWDDALFFKRVAYNVLHHGFAGWNQGDGPVFVNTSQLFQGLATVALALFPHHYNAAIVFWGAVALALSLWGLARAVQASLLGVFLLFFLLQAPPLFLSLTTGMETPTAILVLVACLFELLRGQSGRFRLALGVGLQLAVYVTRPDAILMTFAAALGLRAASRDWKGAFWFGVWTCVGLLITSLCFHAYYGTALPLSTFLKVSPISIYDARYLSTGRVNKLKNLLQIGVLLLPLVPLIAFRRDRTNLVLCGAALLFVAFHALTTYEIAAYHARFYAPCLPFFFAAALRGVPLASVGRRPLWLLGTGAFTLLLFALVFSKNWLESSRGYGPDVVSAEEYLRCLMGVPALGLLLLAPALVRFVRRSRVQVEPPAGDAPPWTVLVAAGVSIGLGALWVVRTLPASIGVVSDEVSNLRTIGSHSADVNIDVIKRCFEEPLRLTHSEIGLPGVLFMESKVIDFTGLANPQVVDGTFDFEAMCESEQPEFIYRPHNSHRALNKTLDKSRCLKQGYTKVKLPRRSTCPLHVRNDLLAKYLACQAGEEPNPAGG